MDVFVKYMYTDGIVIRKFGIYLITHCHLGVGSVPTCKYAGDLYQ